MVADALKAVGAAADLQAMSKLKAGIWGKPCALTQQLKADDRVEIYRPLLVDPKDARRARQAKQRKQLANSSTVSTTAGRGPRRQPVKEQKKSARFSERVSLLNSEAGDLKNH